MNLIKKGDLLKANANMWGSFFSNLGHVNYKIRKNTIFVAVTDSIYIHALGKSEICGLIDNRIVTIRISDNARVDIINESCI